MMNDIFLLGCLYGAPMTKEMEVIKWQQFSLGSFKFNVNKVSGMLEVFK